MDEVGNRLTLDIRRVDRERHPDGGGCEGDAPPAVGGDDHVGRALRDEPVTGLTRHERTLRLHAAADVAHEPAHTRSGGVGRAGGPPDREMHRGREGVVVRRGEPGLELDHRAVMPGHRIMQMVEDETPVGRVHEDHHRLLTQEVARCPQQLGRCPVRLEDDADRVGDEVPVGRQVEQLAVTGGLEVELLLRLGQGLVLTVDLLRTDLELLDGRGQLFEHLGDER